MVIIQHKLVKLFLLKEKIKHELSSPYVPQENGRIERALRTITGAARAMLSEANMGQETSAEALKTACYLVNRLPTARSNLTPFERVGGKAPYVKHLVQFRRYVQVINNWGQLDKLEPKTAAGRVVGFTNRRNTYRVRLEGNGRAIEAYLTKQYTSTHQEALKWKMANASS